MDDRLIPDNREVMKKELLRINEIQGLSIDSQELVTKLLAE